MNIHHRSEFAIIVTAMKRTLNTTINRSKSEKNDEHYTQLADIENEVRHYRDQLRGMTVLCNCDDPRSSNFFKYFTRSFEILGSTATPSKRMAERTFTPSAVITPLPLGIAP